MKKVLLALFNFIKALLGICFVFFGAVGYSLVSDTQSTGDKVIYIILPSVFVLFGLALFYSIIRKKIKKKAPQPVKQGEVQSQNTYQSHEHVKYENPEDRPRQKEYVRSEDFVESVINESSRSAEPQKQMQFLTSVEMFRIERLFEDRYNSFLMSGRMNGKEVYQQLCLEYSPEKYDAPSASFIEDLLEKYSYKYLDPALNHQKSTVDSEETAGSFEDLSNLRRVFDEAYAEYLKNPCVDGSIILDVLENQYHPDDLPEPEALYFRRLEAEYRGAFNDATKEKRIGMMDGIAFENFCVALLKANGFTDVQTTAVSGDQGVDIVAVKDSIRYAVQCKCYSHALGNTPVQEVNAGKAFYNCHVGVVMTNQTFTQGGIDLAAKTQTLLWGMDKLLELMEAVKVDVTFEPRDTEVKA